MQKLRVVFLVLVGLLIIQLSAQAIGPTRLVVGKFKAADEAAKTLTVVEMMGPEKDQDITLTTDDKTEYIGFQGVSELVADDMVYVAYRHDSEAKVNLALSIQRRAAKPVQPKAEEKTEEKS
ncbi:MAG: hypothetical protein A3G33_04765 [Omnitrophica bacterium RIFCSPLOWO2_12_FULL_44_17]|uniref:DUF5666 domain-containing protein n=1 Tax=Candidatus Danuiimicrobium aquiferis TaxID=1801832 RepID=A0A1G1KQR8_9BACT|nr:MAG: hypothetical protein A3B72_10975 [Omnitrophica bacterium RIFCSPHIGHO2_02_FULL_45_28]OGW92468.1 MAG: hypothetical protein A3E74_06815 [Omnitrophica bacterium RIFCSPHIGHO2_12_FULL_44_12]OGW95246.1 MAG: hypothetical protein A3G33_04765 [Omnitrophica bacterium RIFCSPLOWO2_12_FULL_44_17]OGX02341.1 MAG: hypothetical protein A3J12_10100 [Omnitrophica bacterium RIFCSPLOWO2_02_FULL_44_11]